MKDYRGKYILWKGDLAKVISDTSGERFIGIEMVEPELCQNCAAVIGKRQFDVIEASMLFQESVKPVPTLATPNSRSTKDGE